MANNFKILITLFLAAIIAVAFIAASADTINPQTNTINRVNESFTIQRTAGNGINTSYIYTVTFSPLYTNKSAISGFALRNGTQYTISATNYTINLNNGTFLLLNTAYLNSTIGNGTFADYTYQDYNYVSDGSSRSMIQVILIFGVIGLLIVIITYVFKSDAMRNIIKR